MKKLMAIVVLGAVVIAMSPAVVHANGAVAAALALGAFATFSILTAPFWLAYAAYPPVTYQPAYVTPPAYYSAPPVTYAPPAYGSTAVYSAPAAPAVQREVLYPNGRHVLYGDGVTTAYRWVWIPNPPAGSPPPPPPAPAR